MDAVESPGDNYVTSRHLIMTKQRMKTYLMPPEALITQNMEEPRMETGGELNNIRYLHMQRDHEV